MVTVRQPEGLEVRLFKPRAHSAESKRLSRGPEHALLLCREPNQWLLAEQVLSNDNPR